MDTEPMQFFETINYSFPVLASTTTTADSSMVVEAVLLSLVIIYLASKVGGELSNRVGLPPVLGELLGGVLIGVSVLHLLVFPEGGTDSSNSLIMNFLQTTAGLSPSHTGSFCGTIRGNFCFSRIRCDHSPV